MAGHRRGRICQALATEHLEQRAVLLNEVGEGLEASPIERGERHIGAVQVVAKLCAGGTTALSGEGDLGLTGLFDRTHERGPSKHDGERLVWRDLRLRNVLSLTFSPARAMVCRGGDAPGSPQDWGLRPRGRAQLALGPRR